MRGWKRMQGSLESNGVWYLPASVETGCMDGMPVTTYCWEAEPYWNEFAEGFTEPPFSSPSHATGFSRSVSLDSSCWILAACCLLHPKWATSSAVVSFNRSLPVTADFTGSMNHYNVWKAMELEKKGRIFHCVRPESASRPTKVTVSRCATGLNGILHIRTWICRKPALKMWQSDVSNKYADIFDWPVGNMLRMHIDGSLKSFDFPKK